MTLFVKCTRNGSDSYISYIGQDQETVISSLTEIGATNIQFIDEAAYQVAIDAIQ